MISVIKPEVSHLMQVQDDIRMADLAEWFAGTGIPFFEGAKFAINESEFAQVAIDEQGTPLCFWGGDDGIVWLFATRSAEKKALSLHKILKPNLDELHARWGKLTAVADSRNTVHHTWLEWLGFDLASENPRAPFGLPFKTYIKDRE